MNVKVSVILPSLNVADYIERCLESVIHQSLKELEILCVDAGSADGTKEILDKYADKDPRIKVLHSGKKSYGRQVNMGLDYASGEYAAVLETDDWIDQDMYQCLYKHAAADGLDYVAADFDLVYRLQNGADYFVRQRLFHGDKQDWYGKILEPCQITTLRSSDYVLWKGIYNRKFLKDNHIRLHESPGAAFQDMGFLQQVKTYARKARYVDQSFYRYRQDRENASSKELDGLFYYEKEFHWINEELGLCNIMKGIDKKYYYFTMSISFLTKYDQIIAALNGDWQDQRLAGPYTWFRRQVSEAVNRGILEEDMYGKGWWEKLILLLASQEDYSQRIIEADNEKKQEVQNFLEKIQNRPVIIFGCGKRGERLMFFCDRNHICMEGFCDNNSELYGKERFGFPVISPMDLKNKISDKNYVVLLSMRNGAEAVYRQLTAMGIKEDRILNQLPEGV